MGKEINHANERIEELVPKFEELLALNPNSEDYAESVRDSLSDLLSVSRDYVDARADFVYTTFGPGGTIRSDMAAAEHLASLNALEATLAEGLENVRGHFCLYPEDDA